MVLVVAVIVIVGVHVGEVVGRGCQSGLVCALDVWWLEYSQGRCVRLLLSLRLCFGVLLLFYRSGLVFCVCFSIMCVLMCWECSSSSSSSSSRRRSSSSRSSSSSRRGGKSRAPGNKPHSTSSRWPNCQGSCDTRGRPSEKLVRERYVLVGRVFSSLGFTGVHVPCAVVCMIVRGCAKLPFGVHWLLCSLAFHWLCIGIFFYIGLYFVTI